MSGFNLPKSPNVSGQALLFIPPYLPPCNVWFSLTGFYLLPQSVPHIYLPVVKGFSFQSLNRTHPHRGTLESYPKVCTKSLNSDIYYLTLFLMSFSFKLRFHSDVLSLQMVNKPFSLHLELALQIFLAGKFDEGEKEGEFNFCPSYLSVLLPYLLCVYPFPLSDSVHLRQLSVSKGLESVLSPSWSLLVIIQKERETLWVQSFEETNISWSHILLVPNWCGVGLFIENAKRQMGPHKIECEVCVFTHRACTYPSRLLVTA